MGSIKMLDVSFINADLPRFKFFDEIETEGSLLLVSPSKWGNTVPVDGEVLEDFFNVVSDEILSAYDPTVLTFNNSGDGAYHSTSMINGGFKYSPEPDAGAVKAGSVSVGITATGGLKEYVLANLDHDYYMSVWIDVEPLVDPTGTVTQYPSSFSPVGNASPSMFISVVNDTSGSKLVNQQTPTLPLTLTDSEPFTIFNCGLHGLNGAFVDSVAAKENVKTFYRYYIEDLTVSGRTEEEVLAIDTALFDTFIATL